MSGAFHIPRLGVLDDCVGAVILNQRVAAIIVTIGLFMLILELVRRKRLAERYALLWLIATAFLLAMAVWQRPLIALASAIGIYYFPSALFAAAFCFILVLLVHFSLTVSRLSDQNKLLAQRLGLVQQRLEQLGAHSPEAEERGAGRPPEPV